MDNKHYIIDGTGLSTPLGFIGLGLAASILGLQGFGLFSDFLVVVSMSIFLGGIAQFVAGIQLWKKGDTFSSTAFTSFGLFWLSFAYILIAPFGTEVASSKSIAWYLIFWGVYAFGMFIGTIKIKMKSLIILFAFLVLTFLLTGFANFGIQLSILPALATLCLGITSIYISLALILETLGCKVPY